MAWAWEHRRGEQRQATARLNNATHAQAPLPDRRAANLAATPQSTATS